MFLAAFAILAGKSYWTEAAISFMCKTSLTDHFMSARMAGARIL